MSKSFVVPSSEVPGYTAIYRHPKYKDGTFNGRYDDITTVYDHFTGYVEAHPKKEFLGTRKYIASTDLFGEYQWLTTTEVSELVNDFGSGLDKIYSLYAPEVDPEIGQQPLGIFSISRADWIISELAAFRSRRYTVGIADDAGVQLSEFGMNDAEIKIIVCSIDKIPRMLERIEYTPTIKVIISMEKLDCSEKTFGNRAFSKTSIDKLKTKAESLGIALFDMDGVMKMGQATPTEPTEPKPEDYCRLCFSSGTTGSQKSIFLTHGSFVYAIKARHTLQEIYNNTYLSFMSLSHIFEHFMLYSLMIGYVRIGFFSGDRANLLQDMQELHPTTFAAVPVLFNNMYNKLAAATIGAKGLKGVLSRIAYRSKLNRIKAGKGFKHSLWDKLIFSKVANVFGGQLKIVSSGSFFLHEDVQNFYRVALSCNLVHGYGQTEASSGGIAQTNEDISTDNIGIPMPGVDVRLRSIPEIGYNVTDSPDPRGELMIRSGSLFSKYHREPEKTAAAMDGEWLATGDILKVSPDGVFTMVERVKNVIKTGQVFWVEPEKLEAVYTTNKLVQSTFIYGKEDECELIAVIIPDPEHFVPWAQALVGNNQMSLDDLCADEKVVKEMVRELKAHALKTNTSKAGTIGLVHLEPLPFAKVNPAFVTSSFKIRRPLVISHYKQVFEAMFEKLGTNVRPQLVTSVKIEK
ncbi:medium-chain fatty acid-CoA ligase faa2 [Coemansia sp. RSA 1722]|nr:medium-chain fatty acid-CoA ligase faa2 [Coemansia sp. RSA 486]KAJ2238065.1 medium-chain fatty acid-CoA ligase faa2 [Coemansia sp. RSA 485]KAJ2603576.1 medium-chain fatty acid-CoA ligase faa2 [Coemansia sp. RSA 1721]KAJ2606178.1 medium-chain fatty acid-CoA ligase faa2 [Coemansia sp. RSA 1722]KAJ2639699.1 medium-chain fatty acid-CoA ligase faa2 [Coemansia sp. RSA 1286]